ncbi:MAG: helix-turn-helix domain-containing protein [Oscillospiraceae bacterium]|jgi:transposase|nr:helix-turn-helix domain-containing protein [Oscillospiraceae bacterium]
MKEQNYSPIVERRLQVLDLAEKLGNISEACRNSGMNRSSFYGWKKRYERFGVDGLFDLPSTPKHNPRTTPESVVKKIVDVSIENPAWGCIHIAEELERQGITISSPTVQKILIKNGIATIKDRWNRLEFMNIKQGFQLGKEKIRRCEKLNPAFKERNFRLVRPGQTLSADVYYAGTHPVLGRLYLSAVVDAYSSFAFADISQSESAEELAYLLHVRVFPFFNSKRIRVGALVSGSGPKFVSHSSPVKTYLRLNRVEHIESRNKKPATNGFVEKFKHIFLDEFLKKAIKSGKHQTLEALCYDFETWLSGYNYERPNNGFPNFGETPAGRFNRGENISLSMDA